MERITYRVVWGCLSTLFLLVTSCHKTDEIKSTIGCDCEGKYALTLTDTLARLSQGGTLYIKGSDKAAYREIMPCDFSKVSGLSASPGSGDSSFTYKISGSLRPPCVANGIAYYWYIDLTSIRRVN